MISKTINPKLKHTSALKNITLILGLPVEVFAITLLFSGFGAGLLISLSGLFIGLLLGLGWSLLLFTPMRHIHKDDPYAWRLWMHSLVRTTFSSMSIEKKDVRVLLTHRVIPFYQWRKK
ncbi:hypothetical protein [Aliivibrio sifiae]|uniref:Uncharacterized protein n=1 Tax=Aliivibrio sifiae TaxID=566293 RepID=A0A2S7X1J7_9GAMM|nr:hypothetical protein [Aliivibrio sifiae]PQJ83531.1 hypothetical protein BTO23_20530 [Aliivibrio sifiae]GLR76835.1 hypothetical protein GCM10007855_37100 [Aliivibrio sifiae]